MVCPAALAETVTPPSFSPVEDAIAPLSSASAASAASDNASGIAASAIAITATEELHWVSFGHVFSFSAGHWGRTAAVLERS